MCSSEVVRRFLPLLLLASLCSLACGCPYSRISPQHTMCRQPSRTCAVKYSGLSEYDIQTVLHVHNDLRRKVANGTEKRMNQPPASNMLTLRWDDELAQAAQKHADNCKFQHDCEKCRELDRFQVGQNLYLRSTSKEDDKVGWETAIKGWFNEVSKFPSSAVDSFKFVPGALHYSLMVWGETRYVGCGFTQFKERLWKKLFVCNYGARGNILGTPVYIRGKPCSKCPEGTKCSHYYPGLCD